MNKAQQFAKDFDNADALMTALDFAGIESNQNWELGETAWTFEDGSKIAVSGYSFYASIDISGPAPNVDESYYMNPNTGSVDTLDGWGEDFDDSLIRVRLDENGDWVEVGL